MAATGRPELSAVLLNTTAYPGQTGFASVPEMPRIRKVERSNEGSPIVRSAALRKTAFMGVKGTWRSLAPLAGSRRPRRDY